MPITFYIRTTEGETKDVDSLKAGLENLVSTEGYRLTISDGEGNEIVIRCGEFVTNEILHHKETHMASLVVRLKEE